jgi:hypothetical protein
MTACQSSTELIETFSFQLIGQLIQPRRIDARAQTHAACVQNKRRVLGGRTGIRQATAYRLIQGFLETLPSLLHRIAQQLFYIRIESHSGPHNDHIMSTTIFAVKMLNYRIVPLICSPLL